MNQAQKIFLEQELQKLYDLRVDLLKLRDELEEEYSSGINWLEKYVKKVDKIIKKGI